MLKIILKYIMQPDDTYLIDEPASDNPEWTDASYAPIFKGICALYAAYSRDQALTEWANILRQIDLV